MPRIENNPIRPSSPVSLPLSDVSGGARSLASAAIDSFEGPALREVSAVDVATSRRPTLILNFQATKQAYHIDWFPATDATPHGPDGRYNMTGPGSACRAYDSAFGRHSESEESRVFRHGYQDRARTGWFGHCDKAAMVAATMLEPKSSVKYNGVLFEPRHIVGLLEEVCDTMCITSDFRGERYNGGHRDNPNDISPSGLLDALRDWTSEGLQYPFIMDKDQGHQVWNQAYDNGKVYESDYPLVGMPRNIPFGAGVKFYQIELGATGVDDANRTYQAYVQRDRSGNVRSQAWIIGGNLNTNPDFLWRALPVGDLTKLETWNRPPSANQHNKQVMPLDVGRLYLATLPGGADHQA